MFFMIFKIKQMILSCFLFFFFINKNILKEKRTKEVNYKSFMLVLQNLKPMEMEMTRGFVGGA